MSATFRPGIVTSDLVLGVDAYNPRSYPGSGGTWFDISGNKLNLTGTAANLSNTGLQSGAAWSTASTLALNTDCHSIFYTLRMSASSGAPDGWSGDWEQIFTYAAGGSDRTPGVWRYPTSRYLHWRYDPGNTGVDFGKDSSGNLFDLGTWYYVGETKNGVTATAYVNGTQVGISASIASPKTRGPAAITLFNSYTANAQIGCVQVYSRPLNASEIQQNFTAIRGNYGI